MQRKRLGSRRVRLRQECDCGDRRCSCRDKSRGRRTSATAETNDQLVGLGDVWNKLKAAALRAWGFLRADDRADRVKRALRPRARSCLGWRKELGRTVSVALVLLVTLFGSRMLLDRIEPFGLSRASKQHSERLSAKMMAPYYTSTAQGHIAVVLIDDSTLQARQIGWPPRYTYYPEVIRRIVSQSPRAVYVDILVQDERTYDESLEEARKALSEDLGTWPVPVWFAVPAPGESMLFSTVRGVHTAPTTWQRAGTDYPLRLTPANVVHWRGRAESGVPDSRACSSAVENRSVVLSLYQQACRDGGKGCGQASRELSLGEQCKPMVVHWGYQRPAVPTLPDALERSCVRSPGGREEAPFWVALREFSKGFWSGASPERLDDERQRCPYTLTLREQELDDPDLAALLEDRVVLVGTKLAGMNDNVISPIHQSLPGVYLHAMALDNLMTWGDQRLSRAPSTMAWAGLTVALLTAIGLALVLRFTSGWRQGLWLLLLGTLVTVVPIVVLQHYQRQPPMDWLGSLGLFVLVVFLARGRSRKDASSPIGAP